MFQIVDAFEDGNPPGEVFRLARNTVDVLVRKRELFVAVDHEYTVAVGLEPADEDIPSVGIHGCIG